MENSRALTGHGMSDGATIGLFHRAVANEHWAKLQSFRGDLAELLDHASRQLMCEQLWGFPPLRVTNGYAHCLQTAMAFVEADHRALIAASTPFELRLLEAEWGWWYLPGEQERVEAVRRKWRKKRNVNSSGVLPSATSFDDF